MDLVVSEIFVSLQGESSEAGRRCAFVRLAGCNLDCAYCDTRYARTGGKKMTLAQVITAVEKLNCPLVEVTGGEPLHQPKSVDLMKALLKKGHEVLLETNGSCDLSPVPRRIKIIMDIKTPSSNMTQYNMLSNIRLLKRTDEIKFVITDKRDYSFSRQIIKKYKLDKKCRVLLSPEQTQGSAQHLAQWILNDKLNVRLNLQLHKIVWPGRKKGI
ncbi:MAG: hypothetical protein A2268_14225 [Candidatus Raymondbacteria bacterium RifOxyA12_full_50_37]|uniref:7-carboxy-7-deazaguanine synthase n=1 Tax=Candidatus Raymondbacteria bacterium RIFOXYD12_FULL_49_13 TaxID=1817890 RepID=A0A1F7FL05_UNCRA|nr:MAG: hypothetical protein A2268_14225 [Candidatus Raymondbacteria bacterium RifOxyA12_full_50_37]OGJ86916.1 MAG: hypothetical protein A2350_02135 [Candidatus Raymondbacteria bacterium RifOxyB12_full_50_8]OGJ88236.1 MAG: hypothetical protein A2248_19565 [Candidatus Raymondbacteria bacterium RIFOXYA2_FULL_49_16]OGJ97103.1 MAG: hypothetical protein A2487_05875 [Candidatus Raymondbacteria bacterium RifOxyC12_full_50_8]OGK07281.1 MAG: hypothetical protein A2519_14235 [Candidatus Raymondbacteria b